MYEKKRLKTKIKKILKYIGFGLLGLLFLLILLIVSLRFPSVQNFVKDKVIHYLENKIHTKVQLDKVYVGFPNSIILENLYLKGQEVDTLLAVHSLEVGLNIPKLLKNTADITSIDLKGVRAHVIRNEKGDFNFQYILDAFATKEEDETDKKPFVISLDKIALTDIGVRFTDHQSQNDINVYFNTLNTTIKTFDLDLNSYGIKNLDVDGLRLKLKQDIVKEVAQKVEEKVDSLSEKKPLKIELNTIKWTNFDVDYEDENSQTHAKILFAELSAKFKNLDLDKKTYEIDQLALRKAKIDAQMFSPDQSSAAKQEVPATESAPMHVILKSLVLDEVAATYNNTAVQPTKQGLDFNHLNFSKINFELQDFEMKKDHFSGVVKKTEVLEKSGLQIDAFSTSFLYSAQEAHLKDLVLKTPKSSINDYIVLNYSSLDQLKNDIGNVAVDAQLGNSKVAFSDVLLLAPQLRNNPPFKGYAQAVLNVDSKAKGTVNDLHIEKLSLSGLDNTVVKANGHLKNMMQPDQLWFDLSVQEFTSSARTVYALVPKNTIPSTISVPPVFSVKGKAKGNAKKLVADLHLASTYGGAHVVAALDMQRKNLETYSVVADLKNLNVGQFIKNKSVGAINGHLTASGTSFDPDRADANVAGTITSAHYNGYDYKNIALNAKMKTGVFDVTAHSKDPNAALDLVAHGQLSKDQPSIKVNGEIEKLDLHRLGFLDQPLIIAGKIDADFSNMNPDALNGYLHLDDFALSDTKEILPINAFKLEAHSTADSNRISLRSQLANIDLVGKYKLTQIFGSMSETLAHYYAANKKTNTSAKKAIEPHQYFTLNAKITNDPLIQKFVPELTSFEDITLTGSYQADAQQLEIKAEIPKVVYGKNSINQAFLTVNNVEDALQYDVKVTALQSESMAIDNIGLKGNVANNIITYDLTTQDLKGVTQYEIAGQLETKDQLTLVSLNNNGLKLNYDNWTVDPENRIELSPKGILAHQFVINNSKSEIGLQSAENTPNSPLNISIKNFEIETITEMIKKDSLLAQGTINGTAQLKDLKNQMSFNSDLQIADLKVFGSAIGNLALKVNNAGNSDRLNADIGLTGNNNNVQLLGYFDTKAQAFDMQLNLGQLQMESVQGFSMNAITEAKGYISGQMNIKGTTKAPSILGKMQFNGVGFNVAQLNTTFKDMNDAIAFTPQGIELNRFKVNDADGNALTVNGKILTQTYKDFAFALKVNARDFKVVDSQKEDNKMLYGVMAVDANLNIGGNLDLPKVDGRLKITDTTDFTFVMPQTNPALEERDGIVEFVDKDQLALQNTINQDSISTSSRIKGMDVSVNIELDKEAKLSVVIDKTNGDFIKLQGEAELTGGIDPSGKTTLTGRYEVNEGAYEMSVNVIKRKFDIQKGSTITWTGEPTKADVNLTAVYKTQAAPIDLVEQQIAGKSPAQLNMYKQRMPFNTLLKMNGELLKPEITFDITTDDNNTAVSSEVLNDVNTKLAQLRNEESEMNKQVFALLLLNRFIGENPFESGAGMSAESIARQSVSKILSQQLNNIAADLISGVELNFDLESTDDYSMGEKNTRTDLNVGVSKRLFNDRLKISVGSNFGLEGEERPNEKMTNIAGNVTFDYALSKDGRYTLRAYRKDEYQVALQGQIIETGLGFVITIEYNKFKEIFENQKQNREFKRKQRNKRKDETSN